MLNKILDMMKSIKNIDRMDRRRSRPNNDGKSGNKLAKKMRKGTVGLKHGAGGVVAQTISEMARDRFLAEKANK